MEDQRGMVSTDEAYLETYQQIYHLFCRKAQVLYDDPSILDKPKVFTQEVGIDLAGINEEIRRAERTFWVTIEQCKQVGQEFSIEKISEQHHLDLFQKRVMLLLIFLKLNQTRGQGYRPEQIVQMLDIRNSVLERFRHLSYFEDASSAFIKEILLDASGHFSNGRDIKYQINPGIMQKVSSFVSVESKDLIKTEKASG